MRKVKVAMIGVGSISGIYLKNITHMFREIELAGLCDLVPEKAEKGLAYVEQAIAEGADVCKPVIYRDMYEAFADPQVEVILNLTRPYEHYKVTKEALLHGKHVYSEKPLAATREEGEELLALSKEKGLFLGGAPDTFLGAGIQTCRKLIEDGYIGRPLGAAGFMISHGPETWHPDPEFFYKHGGGPMFDMGPYYLTAMVNLLGNVEEVFAMTKQSFDQRVMTCKEHYNEIIDVEVPTYYAGTMRFENGVIGTLFTTFDVHYEGSARLEIYGSEGTLIVPDPNTFGGPVKLLRPQHGAMQEVPLVFDYKENSRALGLADMAKAIRTGRRFRANGDMTYHVLEIMESFAVSGREKRMVPIVSRFEKTPIMTQNNIHGLL